MRLALVSDVHGNLPALEAVVADLARRDVDRVVNLGDCLSGPLLPLETARFLMARRDWVHLAGNHERQLLDPRAAGRGPSDEYAVARLGPDELAWVATLRPVRAEDGLVLCHGTPASDVEYLLETVGPGGMAPATGTEVEARLGSVEAPLVACGHSHVARVVRSARGQLLVNPGSVGLPGFLSDWPAPHRVENRSPDARYAVVERTDRGWTASLVAVPYDHEPMARLAEAAGRPEWASALRTGYVR
jgi:predicted phosphodiesterase